MNVSNRPVAELPGSDLKFNKSIIGEGFYDSAETATTDLVGNVFRIVPAPVPFAGMAVFNLATIAFSTLFHFVAKFASQTDPGGLDTFLVYYAPIFLAILTCGVLNTITYFRHTQELNAGAWLEYDLETRAIHLVRVGIVLDEVDIDHLQYISTPRPSQLATAKTHLSELNVVGFQNGEPKRWPLLRSIAADGAFRGVLKGLREETDLSVIRVKSKMKGEGVTEEQLS